MRAILAILFLTVLGEAQQTSMISCRLLGFQTVNDENSLTSVGPKMELACPFQDAEISPPVRIVAVDHVISFIDSKDRKPACSIAVPADLRQAILVLMRAPPNSPLPWRGIAIEDALKTFPNGGALVINLHTASVRLAIGEHKCELKPGAQAAVEMPVERDDFNMATVAFQFNQEEQWITAKETKMRFTQGLRYLVLCCGDPDTKRPIISMYQDRPFLPLSSPLK